MNGHTHRNDYHIKLLGEGNEGIKLLTGEVNAGSTELSKFVPDTYMYRPSRVMKSLQYLTEVNVIRIWNDKVMDIQPSIEKQTENMYLKEGDNSTLS